MLHLPMWLYLYSRIYSFTCSRISGLLPHRHNTLSACTCDTQQLQALPIVVPVQLYKNKLSHNPVLLLRVIFVFLHYHKIYALSSFHISIPQRSSSPLDFFQFNAILKTRKIPKASRFSKYRRQFETFLT